MKIYKNKNIGKFISLPTKQFECDKMHSESDNFLDTLYFARYFRKLKNADVEQLRSSPHYHKTLSTYKKLLAGVDTRDIPAVEKALKYNIELFNPLRATQQIGGDKADKRKSYYNVQLLKISNNKYKPIVHLGGDAKTAAQPIPIARPSAPKPLNNLKPIRPIRSKPPMRASTKLEKQILNDLETIQKLDSPESTIKFSNEFLTNPTYVNISKFVPALIFHHESSSQLAGGNNDANNISKDEVNDIKQLVRQFYHNKKPKKEFMELIENIKKRKNYSIQIPLTGLLEQIKITDLSVRDNIVSLLISIDKLETTSINQDGTDVNDTAAEEETREEIHKIEEDPDTRDGEITMRLTKAGRYVTFWVEKAKVLYGIISTTISKPAINSAKLRIAKGTEDFLNQVTKTPNTELSNKIKQNLTIYNSFALMMIIVVLSSLSRYTGQNITSETLGISGASKVNNAQYYTEVQETFSKETQKNMVNHDPFTPSVSYTERISEQAGKINSSLHKQIKYWTQEKNADELHMTHAQISGNQVTTYQSPNEVVSWGKHVLRVPNLKDAAQKFVVDGVKQQIKNSGMEISKAMEHFVRNEAMLIESDILNMIDVLHIPVGQIALDSAKGEYGEYGEKILAWITEAIGHILNTYTTPNPKGNKKAAGLRALASYSLNRLAREFRRSIDNKPTFKPEMQDLMFRQYKDMLQMMKLNEQTEMAYLKKIWTYLQKQDASEFLKQSADDQRKKAVVTILAKITLTPDRYDELFALGDIGLQNYLSNAINRQKSLKTLVAKRAFDVGVKRISSQ